MAVVPWRPEEDEELIRRRELGEEFETIGAKLRRATASCEIRHTILIGMSRYDGNTRLGPWSNRQHMARDAAFVDALNAAGGFGRAMQTFGDVVDQAEEVIAVVRAAADPPVYAEQRKRRRNRA